MTELRAPSTDELSQLISKQKSGSSLLQPFYCDPEIFEQDIDRIHMRRWLCAGHASEVSEPGEWFRYDLMNESLIIMRGQDGNIRALVNVCRHRGSLVCSSQSGRSNRLVCPYHGWVYDSEGKMRQARNMGDADLSNHDLATVPCRVVEGLIFVNFSADPVGFDHVEGVLKQSLGRYGWANAKIAHRAQYSVSANWKLVTENYQECYHCRPAHPEFSRFHSTERPEEATADLRKGATVRAAAQGIEIEEFDLWPHGGGPGLEGVACANDAMYEGSVTGSENGSPLAPLMGDFGDYCDGFFTYVEVGPASFFLAYPDHGVIYRFVPRGAQQTDMEVMWLVDSKAEENVDYQIEELIWLWDVTSIADKKIIEDNQKGVNSRFYKPGPYGPMENMTRDFSVWYIEQLGL